MLLIRWTQDMLLLASRQRQQWAAGNTHKIRNQNICGHTHTHTRLSLYLWEDDHHVLLFSILCYSQTQAHTSRQTLMQRKPQFRLCLWIKANIFSCEDTSGLTKLPLWRHQHSDAVITTSYTHTLWACWSLWDTPASLSLYVTLYPSRVPFGRSPSVPLSIHLNLLPNFLVSFCQSLPPSLSLARSAAGRVTFLQLNTLHILCAKINKWINK